MRKPISGSLLCAFLALLAGGSTTLAAQEKPAAAPITAPQPQAEVQALLDKAKALAKQYKWPDALKVYDEALSRSRSLKDQAGEAMTLLTMGLAYQTTGQPQKAQENFEQALPIYRAIGSKLGEAKALGNMGFIYASTGQPMKALETFEQALPIYQAAGDKSGEAKTRIGIGNVYVSTGQPQKALETFEQALSLYRAAGDKGGEAVALTGIGIVYQATSQLDKAVESYEQALPALRAAGDRRGEANALNNIAAVYLNTGQPQKAMDYLEQALPLYQAVGDKDNEASALNNLGSMYQATGQLQKALETYEQALTLKRAIGDRRGEATALSNISSLYSDIGQSQKAMETYEQALPILRAAGDKGGEANALTAMGFAHAAMGQRQKALEAYEQALPLYRAVGDKRGEGNALNSIANVYAFMGQPPKALEYSEQALPILRAAGDKRGEANALTNIGLVYESTGQPQKALETYEQVLPLYRAVGDKSGEADALDNLVMVERPLHRPQDALTHSRQAVALVEQVRAELGGYTEAKSAFLASKLYIYYHALAILLEQGQVEEAFDLAQKTKARALLDLLASGRVDLAAALTPEERKQEQDLRMRADFLNTRLVKEGVENEVGAKKRFAAFQEQLKQTENQLQTLTDTLYARHPGLADKRAARTAGLTDIARLLPPDTALLEYLQVSRESLLLFVVTTAGGKATVTPYAILVKDADLQKQCADLRAACSDPNKAWQDASQAAYHLLVSPAEAQLAGKTRLVVCPDGPLWDVPFAALTDSAGKPLLDRFEMDTAYSATGIQAALKARSEHKQASGTLLAFANPDFGTTKRFGSLDSLPGQRPIDAPSRPIDTPSRPFDTPSRPFDAPSRPIDAPSRPIDAPSRPIDAPSRPLDIPSRQIASLLERGGGRIASLPGTQREADALIQDFPNGKVYTGEQAQEETAKQEMNQYRYLHFATHGFFNDASPLLSSIVLAQPTPGSKEDGFLTAREIFSLDLSGVEMTVLSACNTARGQTRTGEGVIGLTWALFAAGCPTQVVSQWSVDDASTATLMERFYAGLKQGKSKGQALWQATQALYKDGKHAHPYYWAPFVLVGDWE